MIMMMTVMMMVFMPMDNWLLPIMMTHIIVSATVPLTVMMLIVSVMTMWPRRCIGKTKRLTLCVIWVCQVVSGKIQVLRATP